MPRIPEKGPKDHDIKEARERAIVAALAEYRSPGNTFGLNVIAEKKGLPPATLYRRLHGAVSIITSNKAKGNLSEEEETIWLDWQVGLARHGFPEDRQRLHTRVQAFIRIRDKNPDLELGKHWADRFLVRHRDVLSVFWGHRLTDMHAKASSKDLQVHWFRLIKDMFEKFNIVQGRTYGADEMGTQLGYFERQKVIGPVSQSLQHHTVNGSRESCTILTTMSGNGCVFPPLVIFKGKQVNSAWLENNPLNAM